LRKEVLEAQKELVGRKMKSSRGCFSFSGRKLPLDQIAYLMAESSNSAALSKIRAFLEQVGARFANALPIVATELEALGMARGATV